MVTNTNKRVTSATTVPAELSYFLNPVAKLLCVLGMGIAAVMWPDFTLALALLVFLMGIAVHQHQAAALAKLLLGLGIPMLIILGFIQGFYGTGNVTIVADCGFAKLGKEGLLYAIHVVATVLVFVAGFFLQQKSTYWGDLSASLLAAGCSSRVTYLLLASLMVVPQMKTKLEHVQRAQQARGLDSSGNIFHRMRMFIPLLGPVILSSLTDAQERGMTLETRGFSIRSVRASSYRASAWRVQDSVCCVAVLALVVIATVVLSTTRMGYIQLWGGLL